MRISCPNCQAQYDVDRAVIPETGRDVQCSSCAHTWFQKPVPEFSLRPATPGEELAADGLAAESGSDAASPPVEEGAASPLSDDAPLPEEIEAETASAFDEGEAEDWDEIEPDPEMDDAAEGDAGEDLAAVADFETKEAAGDADDVRAKAAEEKALTAPNEAARPVEDEVDAADEEAPVEDATVEVDGDDDHDAGDKVRAAIDRPKGAPVDPEPQDSEGFRTSMRDAVTHTDPDPATARQEPGLDRDVADILREEAEFEVTRRRSEDAPPAFEPQGDLALEEGRASNVLRERLDRMRGDGIPEPTIAASLAASEAGQPEHPRRDRLPDIEQINSSLRPGEGTEPPEIPLSPSEVAAARRSGFRAGFSTVIAIVAVAVGAYVYAPQIIRLAPSTEPAMISYVDFANATRDRIDGMMARAISGINGVVGEDRNGA
ncbi:MAG: zinc-ribbon domain-containing protein [Paracoccaceae bacterium]|nr:zinc-ribbon domain-containing protein [Paracoccaceae bacterium]